MWLINYSEILKSPKLRLAWGVALAADALQLAALPLFVEGAASPADAVLDVIVAGILMRLLGWHWAFLPSVVAKLVPAFDLFPTWTAAVWYVTRNPEAFAEDAVKGHTGVVGEPEILPPGPAPARRP